MNLLYQRLLGVILLLPFLLFGQVFAKKGKHSVESGVKCDPTKELKHIANLSYYYTLPADPGQILRLTCKMGYGVSEKNSRGTDTGIINPAYTVVCQKDGTFTGYQDRSCQPACNVSDALSAGNNVKHDSIVLHNGATIPFSSRLVKDGASIVVSCISGYILEGGDKTSYKYTCYSDPQKRESISKCVEKPPNALVTKPSSKSSHKTKFGCNLALLDSHHGIEIKEIRGADSKLLKTPNVIIGPGVKTHATCEPGYSTILDGKFVEKFTAICDPKGSGKFFFYDAEEKKEENRYKSLLTCTKRCTAEALISASSPVNSDNKIIATVSFPHGNRNASDNSYSHIGFEDTVKVACPSGYEIRSEKQESYSTTCSPIKCYRYHNIKGKKKACKPRNFTKLLRCEPIIPPCNNREIVLDGLVFSLANNAFMAGNRLLGVTRPGNEIDLVCKGGEKYFQKSANQNGKPKCIYDSTTKKSHWDNVSFKCYDRCIGENNQKMAIGDAYAVNKYKPNPLWIDSSKTDFRYTNNCKLDKVEIGIEDGNRNPFFATEDEKRCFFGLSVKQNYDVAYCYDRQTVKNIKVEYKAFYYTGKNALTRSCTNVLDQTYSLSKDAKFTLKPNDSCDAIYRTLDIQDIPTDKACYSLDQNQITFKKIKSGVRCKMDDRWSKFIMI